MKKNWEDPIINNLCVKGTNETRDAGHLDPEEPHIHHCYDCGLTFANHTEAAKHEDDTAQHPENFVPATHHHVGVMIIS